MLGTIVVSSILPQNLYFIDTDQEIEIFVSMYTVLFPYSNPVLLPESIIRGHLSYSCQVLNSYSVGRLWVAGFDLTNILTIHIINKK